MTDPDPDGPGPAAHDADSLARLWAAKIASSLGARVSREALPFAAVITLGAGPAALGALAAARAAPAILVGLFGAPFAGRGAPKTILVAADLARALVLAAAAAAAVRGGLTFPGVVAAAALVSGASVLFDIVEHAWIPELAGPGGALAVNARFAATESTAEVVGPAIGGVLVQIAGPAGALATNVIAYGVSAVALLRIRRERPHAAEATARPGDPGQVPGLAAGFAAIGADRAARGLLAADAATALAGGAFSASYLAFAVRGLGLTPGAIGLAVGLGGVGALAGAAIAPTLQRRLGSGPGIALGAVAAAGALALIPFAPAHAVGGFLVLAVSQVAGDAFATVYLVLAAAVRQSRLPARDLAAAAGVFEATGGAALLAGAAAGSAIGLRFGLRAEVGFAAAVACAAPLLLLSAAGADFRPAARPGEL